MTFVDGGLSEKRSFSDTSASIASLVVLVRMFDGTNENPHVSYLA